MIDTAAATKAFLRRHGWHQAVRNSMTGDASARRYERLTNPKGDRAILMLTPPEQSASLQAFVKIDNHLIAQGLNAPEILAQDIPAGLLLLEDFGDDLVADVIQRRPGLETQIYRAAADVLLALHQHPAPTGLAGFTPTVLAQATDPAWDFYLPKENPSAQAQFETAFHQLLQDRLPAPKVLVLRDFHAENLIWLPDRSGLAQVGLLDFQDALLGHPAYDLVSLLQDARRDITP